MKNKTWILCCIVSFACWLLPFAIRVFFVEVSEVPSEQLERLPKVQHDAMQETLQLLSTGDKHGAFLAIFKNNLKGCIINIAGGALFGVGTLFNLMFNGFFAADMFVSYYKIGMSMSVMLRVTLPHSFELIGFWLSGALGLRIAWSILQAMRGKGEFTVRLYRQLGVGVLSVFLITLAAAYVEAYISTSVVVQ
jgi:uncharacterized membrane protein SpoIIM required for sporulation